jgi:catalase
MVDQRENRVGLAPDGRVNRSASAGVGWTDHPESPEVRASLAEKVGAQQTMLAAGNPALCGHIARGQHQKQLLGAFGAVTILETAPAEVRLGPFAKAGRYKAACRISNGQACPHADRAPDVRGVAIKLVTRDGVETDFLMTNEGGRSHTRDAVQFMDIADLLAAKQVKGGTVQALKELATYLVSGKLNPIEAARAAGILIKETVLHKVESIATEHYWGSVVQVDGRALKYSLHPHPATSPGTIGISRDPDYLRVDLVNRLSKGALRYDMSVQLYIDEEATPVNDASIAWKAPLVAVAELTIPTMPSKDDEQAIDRFAFDPTHGFTPLGITHARGDVYAASARNRGALSSDEIRSYFFTSS